jgi:hypothetical protein
VNPFVVSDQRHRIAAANLAQAREEGQLYGHERRREIRRRVEEQRARKLEEEKSKEDAESA